MHRTIILSSPFTRLVCTYTPSYTFIYAVFAIGSLIIRNRNDRHKHIATSIMFVITIAISEKETIKEAKLGGHV